MVLSEYEQYRARKIQRNNARLRQLGLIDASQEDNLNKQAWKISIDDQRWCTTQPKQQTLPGIIVASYKSLQSNSSGCDSIYWEVHSIVGHRIRNNIDEFLIRWKGCSKKHDTWEPRCNLNKNTRTYFK